MSVFMCIPATVYHEDSKKHEANEDHTVQYMLRDLRILRAFVRKRGPGSEPPGDRHLLVRVELDPVAPVRLQVAEETVLRAAEREIRHRRRDADIDADHRRRGVLRKLTGGLAAR